MEEKEREELRERIGIILANDFRVFIGDTDNFIEEFLGFVEEEISKAREEGYQKKVKEAFTEEQWEMLLDAVDYHGGCKKCKKEIKNFHEKNWELLQEIGVYI